METSRCYLSFVFSSCMALLTVVRSQHVSVDPQVTAYLGYDVKLRCQFIQGGPEEAKLSQVEWTKELLETAIVVKSPTDGTNFNETPFEGRVSLISDSVEDASISISNVNETDEGRYTCKYTTFPGGVVDATTTLTVQAKPPSKSAEKRRQRQEAVTNCSGSKQATVVKGKEEEELHYADIRQFGRSRGNPTPSTE
ncbi:hypothetical protein AGOR_G00212010 [Albula goreensis]|uniref:Ig-like domain-containing protein n=1 Tax=Albula goreensis TaxID=1534307 RepID=A0A8T3CUE8_9TELE|nr:hypothetical protein AGOR_G00212010 [Albula goreensis]